MMMMIYIIHKYIYTYTLIDGLIHACIHTYIDADDFMTDHIIQHSFLYFIIIIILV